MFIFLEELEEEEECQIAIFYFAQCVSKLVMLYTYWIENQPQNTMVVFKMRDNVPSTRYSIVCNVLHLRRIMLNPTYRVYRLYDTGPDLLCSIFQFNCILCSSSLVWDINIHLCHTGDVTIPGGMIFTVDSDLNGDSPQFTFTCTSTGGPATTVTWTRDSETVSGGMTVLNNAVTAQYTHILTVTGRLGGQYQCNVTNNKPSTTTAQFTVQGKRIKKYKMYL